MNKISKLRGKKARWWERECVWGAENLDKMARKDPAKKVTCE